MQNVQDVGSSSKKLSDTIFELTKNRREKSLIETISNYSFSLSSFRVKIYLPLSLSRIRQSIPFFARFDETGSLDRSN